MNTILAIVRTDMLIAWRDRRLPVLILLSVAIALAAVWVGIASVGSAERARAAAAAEDRAAWLAQPPVNAHSAAHFGHMAFKPVPRLAAVEPGLSDWTGTTVWLEAHYQDPANARPIEDRAEVAQFGALSPAWLVAVVAPLMMMVAGFPLLTVERETGQWRSMAATGLGPGRLLTAKLLSLATISGIALLPILLAVAGAGIMSTGAVPPDFASRLAGLLLLSIVYLLAFAAVVLAVAAWAGGPRRALLLLAMIWAASVIAVPRLAATAADRLAPIPGSQAFWSDIQNDLAKGVDGHDPAEQAKRLEQAMLARYHVKSVDDLPFGFAGLTLQAGEVRNARVFDRRYGALVDRYRHQRAIARWGTLFSPTIAFQEASAALAGTDERHHADFTAAAEAHRRRIVAQLNHDVLTHGAGSGRRGLGREADVTLWQQVPAFSYAPPALGSRGQGIVTTDLLLLLAWLVVGMAVAGAGVRRWVRP